MQRGEDCRNAVRHAVNTTRSVYVVWTLDRSNVHSVSRCTRRGTDIHVYGWEKSITRSFVELYFIISIYLYFWNIVMLSKLGKRKVYNDRIIIMYVKFCQRNNIAPQTCNPVRRHHSWLYLSRAQQQTPMFLFWKFVYKTAFLGGRNVSKWTYLCVGIGKRLS